MELLINDICPRMRFRLAPSKHRGEGSPKYQVRRAFQQGKFAEVPCLRSSADVFPPGRITWSLLWRKEIFPMLLLTSTSNLRWSSGPSRAGRKSVTSCGCGTNRWAWAISKYRSERRRRILVLTLRIGPRRRKKRSRSCLFSIRRWHQSTIFIFCQLKIWSTLKIAATDAKILILCKWLSKKVSTGLLSLQTRMNNSLPSTFLAITESPRNLTSLAYSNYSSTRHLNFHLNWRTKTSKWSSKNTSRWRIWLVQRPCCSWLWATYHRLPAFWMSCFQSCGPSCCSHTSPDLMPCDVVFPPSRRSSTVLANKLLDSDFSAVFRFGLFLYHRLHCFPFFLLSLPSYFSVY